MGLRDGDSLPYLRFKQNLADTDCSAVFQDGSLHPVMIRHGGTQLFIEQGYKFYDPEKMPGFVRFVRKPEAQPPTVEALPAASIKLQGTTTAEIKQDAETKARAAINERYANRLAAQGITSQAEVTAGNAMYDRRADEFAKARNPENRRKRDWRAS